jgi:hypothetical protein
VAPLPKAVVMVPPPRHLPDSILEGVCDEDIPESIRRDISG